MKKIVAALLSVLIVLQCFSGFSVSAWGTGTIITDAINKEGLWLTEIYQNDVDRSEANDTRAANDYESIKLYTSNADLMEFIEISSTHEADIKLNEMYEIYSGDILLTITDMNGNSDITIKKAQAVVLWNYRGDITTGIPTEKDFRLEMRIPDEAVVLKAVTNGGKHWPSTCSFSIKRKLDAKVISEFTATNNVENADGFSCELNIPHLGSEMAIYHKMTIPSAGYVYSGQLNWLVDAYVPEK